MNNLILPVAGKSSRYEGTRPKWLMVAPSCTFMVVEAIKKLPLEKYDKIYLGCLKEHLKKYGCKDGIKAELQKVHKDVNVIELTKQTDSQPETVHEIIKKGNITGGITIKDCDNQFSIDFKKGNNVSYCYVGDYANKLENKSYIQLNNKGYLNNIVEKKIISNYFCSGLYQFENVDDYVKYYNKLKGQDNFYISHIIYAMILDGYNFGGVESREFVDWGVLEDWIKYVKQFKTLFLDIDGVLCINGSKYFKGNKWGETKGLTGNIKTVNDLYDSGKGYIVLTTSRDIESSVATKKQLLKLGVKYHKIIYGLPHCQRIVINDYSRTNSYPSCGAINIKRNDDCLGYMGV